MVLSEVKVFGLTNKLSEVVRIVSILPRDIWINHERKFIVVVDRHGFRSYN
jgi:hypothetical protein